MNFTEAVELVIARTGRPDKLLETRNAVNAAIKYCNIKAKFTRDLVETTTLINTGETYTGIIDLSGYTNFRLLKYIRPTTMKDCLKYKQPEGMFSGGYIVSNTYYIGGTNLNWVTNIQTPSMEVGYYVFPPTLTDSLPNHWLLDVYPECILDIATGSIFKSIGDSVAMQSYLATGMQQYVALRNEQEDPVVVQAT